jgi:hypothetical protein
MQPVFQVIIEATKQNPVLTIILAILPTATGGFITIFQDCKNRKNEKRIARRNLYTEIRENLQQFLFQVNAQLTNLNNIKVYGLALSTAYPPLKEEPFLNHDLDESSFQLTTSYLRNFCEVLFQNTDKFKSIDILAQFYIEFIKTHCFELLNPNFIIDMTTACLIKIITPVRLIGGTIQDKEEALENYINSLTQAQMKNSNLWDIKAKIVELIKFTEDEIKKL